MSGYAVENLCDVGSIVFRKAFVNTYGSAGLKSQHLENRGRKITSSRSALAT